MEHNNNTILLNEHEAADRLGIKVSTLRRWRVKGSDLPFIRIGGRIKYADNDIEGYIQSRRVLSTSADVANPSSNGGGHDQEEAQ
jgi:predicted DNA-binding transcriptional regulator AlpA